MNKDDFVKMMEDGYKLLTREETLEEKSFRVGYEYAVNKMFYIVMNSDKEINRLNNIIEELEKELKEGSFDVYFCSRSSQKTFKYNELIIKAMILDKLKELKEGVKDE